MLYPHSDGIKRHSLCLDKIDFLVTPRNRGNAVLCLLLRSQTILPPTTPNSLPALLLLQAASLLQPQASLHPLLTAHLAQPAQRACEGKALLVAAEQRGLLQHGHVHAEVVHQVAHDVVDVVALIVPRRPRGRGLGLLDLLGDVLLVLAGRALVAGDFVGHLVEGFVQLGL